MTDETPIAPAHDLNLRFVGSGSEYFRIWIVNLLLTLLTLGLYYPFAKVRRLRYFHGVTEVGGSAMSFHADPWKMFRGYVLVVLLLGAYSGASEFSPAAGAVAFLVVAALWPALWHSSMRFRLANTGWRGLRLRYTGTVREAYAVMAVPLGVAMLFVLAALLQPTPGVVADPVPPPATDAGDGAGSVLGIVLSVVAMLALPLLMPVFFWLLKRLQHASYALGAERTRFTASLGSFYGVVLRTAGVGLLVALALGAVVLGAAAALGSGLPWLAIVAGAVGYLGAFSLVGGYWTARMQNLVWSSTASPHLRFESRLSAWALARLWLRNAVLVVLTLGLYFPFAQVASARLRLESVTVISAIDPDVLAGAADRADESAAGDAAGDLFGFDIGL